MRLGKLASTLVISTLVIFLAPTSAALAAPFTDAAGRTIDLPEKINSAAAAGPPASAFLYIIAPEKMVGWVKAPATDAQPYLKKEFLGLPVHGRITGKDPEAAAAAVAKLKPDVIIDVGDVNAKYAALADKVQQQTGKPVILLDGALAKTPDTLLTLGNILGSQARAKELSAYATQVLAAAATWKASHPTESQQRVYWARGKDGLETAFQGSVNADFISAAGAVNAAGTDGAGVSSVTIQQVKGWNPDIIFVENPAALAVITHDTAWSDIGAVKRGKVYLSPSLPFGWVDGPPGPNRLIGLGWVEQILEGHQPDAKSYGASVKTFYKMFYQVDVTDDDVAKLLVNNPK